MTEKGVFSGCFAVGQSSLKAGIFSGSLKNNGTVCPQSIPTPVSGLYMRRGAGRRIPAPRQLVFNPKRIF